MEVLACPNCQRLFFTPPAALGKKIRCRGCQQIFHVPKEPSSVPFGPAVEAVADQTEHLPIAIPCTSKRGDCRRCPGCGREFLMKESFVGKSIRCRGCKEPFRVTATVARPSDARLVQLPAGQSFEPNQARDMGQPSAHLPSWQEAVSRTDAAAFEASPRPTIFEDIGDVLDDLKPGEQIASVVRPRTTASLAKPGHEAIATLIAIVLGAACALPAVQLILWWAFDQDPLNVGKSLPNFLEWIAPPQWRN